MIRLTTLAAVAAAALAACATAPQPPATQATVDAHVADAKRLAGDDLAFLMPVCNPQPAVRAKPGPKMDEMLAKLIQRPPPAPGQAFDNLYYVGSAWVSAWVLKTSQGLILIDALNNNPEATQLIEGGMKTLGLDPAQIRYIVVTHGHGDHYGGAQMLADRYKARVVASEIDWKMMETELEFDSKEWARPPKRDLAVKDGDTLTLGDTTIRFLVTPGHTLGTLSPVFDVRDKGKTHKALIWGGTSFNFGRDMGRLDGYIAQTERVRKLSAQWGIDVLLSNHPGYDGTVAKLKARAAAPQGANPFVSGQPVVDRAMQVLNTCAQAQKARFLIAASAGHGPAYASALDGLDGDRAPALLQTAAVAAWRPEAPAAGSSSAAVAQADAVRPFPFADADGRHGETCGHDH